MESGGGFEPRKVATQMEIPDLNPNLNFQLVSTLTPDEAKLHGMYIAPVGVPRETLNAAIVLHGLGGNFYGSTLNLKLAAALNQLGLAVLLVNTRGHDGISTNRLSGRAVTMGAAYEIVDDCRYDILGWVDWLKNQGYSSTALVGHSLGAIKALYAASKISESMIQAIVGISATRLSHLSFLKSAKADLFRQSFNKAKELVEQGRGQELLSVEFPFPTVMAANAYRDKYGPEDRYDWTSGISAIHIPTLLMYGARELEENAAFSGLLQTVEGICREQPNVSLHVVESANHFYAGVHHRVVQAVQDWIKDRF